MGEGPPLDPGPAFRGGLVGSPPARVEPRGDWRLLGDSVASPITLRGDGG